LDEANPPNENLVSVESDQQPSHQLDSTTLATSNTVTNDNNTATITEDHQVNPHDEHMEDVTTPRDHSEPNSPELLIPSSQLDLGSAHMEHHDHDMSHSLPLSVKYTADVSLQTDSTEDLSSLLIAAREQIETLISANNIKSQELETLNSHLNEVQSKVLNRKYLINYFSIHC
jgi:hypothetical protein